MNSKKVMSIGLAGMMTLSLAACGSSSTASTAAGDAASGTSAQETGLSYADVVLGETGTDVTATIKFLTNRTDVAKDDYAGTSFSEYLEEFNKVYPNITVEIEPVTDYAEDSLLRLQGGDWGDVMLIPAVDSSQFADYFMPLGSLDEMSELVRFATDKQYGGTVYGVATTGNASGIVYNKKVFEDAGVTEIPKTPEEFINALKAVKDNTDAIPLYTNYAAGWTMGAWDDYIAGAATGDSTYKNQKLAHTANPFSDPGDGTGAYNVYRILYDAVAEGLTEDDYTTTDWEGSKGMLNNGSIGCMVLGSWAYSQMQAAGDHAEDIGYMPFPITVDGKQYAGSGADYSYAVNKDASDDNKLASLIFIKWMTEESGFSYNEGGMPISLSDDRWPELYSAFDGIDYVSDEPAVEGEEDLLSTLNADSELNVGNGGDLKIQNLIEHASIGDESFDEIMNEWNEAWTNAQELNDVEVNQ